MSSSNSPSVLSRGYNSSRSSTPDEGNKGRTDESDAMDQKAKNIQSMGNEQRFGRLQFLIEKSKIYTGILTEKLQREQNQARQRDSHATNKKAKSESSSQVQPTTRVTRSGAEPESHHKASPNDAPKKKSGKGSRANGQISSIIKEEDLAGREQKEDDAQEAGVTAVTRPSASARQPSLVSGCILRDYQLAGLEWLVSLYENGLNGILADEMGLGKTLQTIAFLAFLREKGTYGPFLVAAPLSTISNWVNEVNKFAPTVPVLLYHGTKTERQTLRRKHFKAVNDQFPIVVTSYEMIINDRKFLQKYQWKYIVVDEGHRIKNLNCRLIRELKSYETANRLLLTGTPLQNNLSELWSLLNFLLPDIFDDLDSFQSWFDFSAIDESAAEGSAELVRQEQQNHIITNLHQILKPFLLRRLKNDVEDTLPRKREYLLYAPMTENQITLYQSILDGQVREYLQKQQEQIGGATPSKSKRKSTSAENTPSKRSKKLNYRELDDDEWYDYMESKENSTDDTPNRNDKLERSDTDPSERSSLNHVKLQNMVMQLRKACNHPYLFDHPVVPGTDDYVVDEKLMTMSGKMLLLDRLLGALLENKHKVLLFSQFTSMLDLIQIWAEDVKNLRICRIDGAVKQNERQEQMKEFNNSSDVNLFLLSTRAGGLGINLSAADTVILFDSDWNPQQDLQAQDRAHRIGQTRPVIVYRLVSANSVESKILEKAESKRKLEKLVIQKGKFKSLATSMDKEDAKEISSVLLRDDAQKFVVKGAGDEIISEADLSKLLDRSEEAYDAAERGESAGGTMFKAIETKRDQNQDRLS